MREMDRMYNSIDKAETGWRRIKFIYDVIVLSLLLVLMIFIIVFILKIKAEIDDIKSLFRDIGKGIGDIF